MQQVIRSGSFSFTVQEIIFELGGDEKMTDDEKKEPEGGYLSGKLLVIRLVLWTLVACFAGLVVLGQID